jgi:nucleotide-binding universal stress UspA family protein
MRIVLATDGSECSEGAARFLTRFHFSPKDEIIVLHVVSDIPYADDYHAQIRHAIKRVAPKIIHAASLILKPLKANITAREEEGLPDSAIMKVADDSNADLIVMGARGLKGVKSFFLGSVTRSVAINSPKPVLVTRPSGQQALEKMKVLLAIDGSHSANATAGLLASLPFPENAELLIMNVAWSAALDIPERFAIEIDDKIKEDIARARALELDESRMIIDMAKPLLTGRFSTIREISKGGEPAAEILSEAGAFEADLIAVGSRGLKGIKGMLGSVSRKILGHSQCPVLVGKAGQN